jgi:hypothetical protein
MYQNSNEDYVQSLKQPYFDIPIKHIKMNI